MDNSALDARQQDPLRRKNLAQSCVKELDITNDLTNDLAKHVSISHKIYCPLPSPSEGHSSHVRLLTLLPGRRGSRMCCELREEPLDQSPTYEALSYVWGTPISSRLITINGEFLAITENLKVALEHLRSSDRPRVLWIDAICIDQSNLLERGEQVLLMRTIYRNASCVLIWLGEQDADSDLAFDVIDSILPVTSNFLERRSLWNYGDRVSLQDKEMAALTATFSQRDFWKRIWIIQEVISARQARLICGNRSIPWHLFERLLNFDGDPYIRSKLADPKLRVQLASAMHTPILIAVFQKESNSLGYILPYKKSLCSLLALFENSLCTDPRDRIYALQNIVEYQEVLITPDYTKPLVKVFAQAAKAMMTTSGLDFLAYTYRSSGPSQLEGSKYIPTWVPDWTKPRLFSTLLLSPNPNSTYYAGEFVRPHEWHSIATDARESPWWCLRLAGVKVDQIESILCVVDMEDPSWKLWFRDWAPAEGQKFCPDDEDTYWRALMQDIRRPTGWPIRLDSQDVSYYRNLFFNWSEHPRYSRLRTPSQQEQTDIPKSYNEDSFADCLGDHLRGWAFCKTKFGRLGWIPSPARVGDLICVGRGTQLPLIIRKATPRWNTEPTASESDFFKLVGTAYMHGIMDGEIICGGDTILYESIALL